MFSVRFLYSFTPSFTLSLSLSISFPICGSCSWCPTAAAIPLSIRPYSNFHFLSRTTFGAFISLSFASRRIRLGLPANSGDRRHHDIGCSGCIEYVLHFSHIYRMRGQCICICICISICILHKPQLDVLLILFLLMLLFLLFC